MGAEFQSVVRSRTCQVDANTNPRLERAVGEIEIRCGIVKITLRRASRLSIMRESLDCLAIIENGFDENSSHEGFFEILNLDSKSQLCQFFRMFDHAHVTLVRVRR